MHALRMERDMHSCLTMATTDSVQLVLIVQLLRWMAAHLQEKLPRSSTTTFFGWAKATRCLYRPYQSLMNGPGSCCVRVCVWGGGGGGGGGGGVRISYLQGAAFLTFSVFLVWSSCASSLMPMGHRLR